MGCLYCHYGSMPLLLAGRTNAEKKVHNNGHFYYDIIQRISFVVVR